MRRSLSFGLSSYTYYAEYATLYKRLPTFLEKIKTVGSVPEIYILVTADVVGISPNNIDQAGLKLLKEAKRKERY